MHLILYFRGKSKQISTHLLLNASYDAHTVHDAINDTYYTSEAWTILQRQDVVLDTHVHSSDIPKSVSGTSSICQLKNIKFITSDT